jgi:hypothetical protein
MSKIASFVVAAVVAAGLAAAVRPQTPELLSLEGAWNQAHLHADADALDRLWHDDLQIAVPRMAVMSKAEALQFMRSARMSFQRYETSDVKVRMYGTTAVVTGRLKRSRTLMGRQVDDDWQFTKVYVRTDNGWRVVSFHASEAPPQ